MFEIRVRKYIASLNKHLSEAKASDRAGRSLSLADAIGTAGQTARMVTGDGGTIFFIGNGGSAGIASHMAIDFTKNGGMRALAFNDGAYLTCLANDLGYPQVFSKPLEMHARGGDLVFAISSSGSSENILNGATAALDRGCRLITLSGFEASNPLRSKGDLNFFIDSHEYGFVEISHLALIHAMLDMAMGWGSQKVPAAADTIPAE